MAKKIRKMLAMVLVMCMLVSALPLQALAAEGDYEFTKTDTFTGPDVKVDYTDGESGKQNITVSGTNENGGALDITGTTSSETSTSEDNNVEKTASETDLSGKESSDGTDKKVTYHENHTYTKETAEDGTITEKTIVDGNETKEWTETETQVGDPAPSVEVQLKPGETTGPVHGSLTYDKEVDNVEGGSTETNSDKTTTTTTVERDVTGTLSNVGVTVNKTDSDLTGAVAPENYEGKNYIEQWPTKDTPYAPGLLTGMSPDGRDPGVKPEDAGYNFVISGSGDATYSAIPVVKNIVYVKDENGNPVKDENGNYIIDEEKSQLVYAGDKAKYSGMNSMPSQIVLKDENGNYFYTYCIDKVTPTKDGVWYKISNLEDSDYYPDVESENKLRAIVQSGYWGTEEGTGSLENVKALLRETYGEEDTVTVKDANGNEHTYNVVDLIDGLQEHEALACTQAAIWSYSNGSLATQNGQDGQAIVGVQSAKKHFNSRGGALNQYSQQYDLESDARLKALYECLINLEGVSAEDAGATTIINEQHNIKDMSLVVNEKVAENGDSDIYNVDLKFALDFDLTENDSLTVILTDAAGNNIKDANGNDIVIEKKLALSNSDNDENTLVAENGVYTLTGLQLSEGTDFNFNLTLEGEQKINDGVYIYQANGGREESQTLVGLASGTQDVNITVESTLSFTVEEEVKHKEERVWHHAFDPVITPPEQPEQPITPPQPPRPNNPQQPAEPAAWTAPENQRLANDEAVEIPEEPVPLAAPVTTGDDTGLWIMALLVIACGMVAVNVFDKKHNIETF